MSSPRSRGSPADLSDRVRRRLLVLAEADGADITERRWAFREAAALLTAFDPATLEAGDPHEAGGALLELIDDCVTVGGPTRRLWSLKREVRDAALRRLSGPEQALRSLEANGDPEARPVERMVRAYLRGAAPALEDQDMEQLSHSLQALRWLTQMGGLEGLPAVEDAMQAYARKQLFGPLESLVGGRFHGRRAELSELRLHVGVLDLTTVSTRVRDARRRMSPFNTVTEPPLMVHGPPGIGKSTLLAKVVLDHARAGDRRIPFVYIDFERPTLSVLEPATLLAEAARQLAVQYPEAAAAFGEIADAASQEAPRQRDAAEAIAELDEAPAARVTVSRELAQAARAEARASDDGLIKQLVAVVRDDVFGGSEEPPLLMVLDSFEQAQYRSSPHLRRLWDLFDAFQRWYPRLRVVVSGRAPVEELRDGPPAGQASQARGAGPQRVGRLPDGRGRRRRAARRAHRRTLRREPVESQARRQACSARRDDRLGATMCRRGGGSCSASRTLRSRVASMDACSQASRTRTSRRSPTPASSCAGSRPRSSRRSWPNRAASTSPTAAGPSSCSRPSRARSTWWSATVRRSCTARTCGATCSHLSNRTSRAPSRRSSGRRSATTPRATGRRHARRRSTIGCASAKSRATSTGSGRRASSATSGAPRARCRRGPTPTSRPGCSTRGRRRRRSRTQMTRTGRPSSHARSTTSSTGAATRPSASATPAQRSR